jgi:hypothetical protein
MPKHNLEISAGGPTVFGRVLRSVGTIARRPDRRRQQHAPARRSRAARLLAAACIVVTALGPSAPSSAQQPTSALHALVYWEGLSVGLSVDPALAYAVTSATFPDRSLVPGGTVGPYAIHPRHLELALRGYPSLDWHDDSPSLVVIPTERYAALARPGSAQAALVDALSGLRALLDEQRPFGSLYDGGGELDGAQAPLATFISVFANGATQFVARPEYIRFGGGTAVRVLTTSIQQRAPVALDSVAYALFGLSDDNQYLVYARMPVRTSLSRGAAPRDAGAWDAFNRDAVAAVAEAPDDAFAPRLATLDDTIRSLTLQPEASPAVQPLRVVRTDPPSGPGIGTSLNACARQVFSLTFDAPVSTQRVRVHLFRSSVASDDCPVEVVPSVEARGATFLVTTPDEVGPLDRYELFVYDGVTGATVFTLAGDAPNVSCLKPIAANNTALARHLPVTTRNYTLSYDRELNLYRFRFIFDGSDLDLDQQMANARRDARAFITSRGIALDSVIIEWCRGCTPVAASRDP